MCNLVLYFPSLLQQCYHTFISKKIQMKSLGIKNVTILAFRQYSLWPTPSSTNTSACLSKPPYLVLEDFFKLIPYSQLQHPINVPELFLHSVFIHSVTLGLDHITFTHPSSHTCQHDHILLWGPIAFISEKVMAPHSSTLAWKIPWTEEPGRLQSMGSRRVRHDWATSLSLFIFLHWRRKWQPTPVFLPGESQGRGSLLGCRLWGRTESDMTEAT